MDNKRPIVSNLTQEQNSLESVKPVANNGFVDQYASQNGIYSTETLEVNDGSGAAAPKFESDYYDTSPKLNFSKRKALIVSVVITLIVGLLSLNSLLFLVRKSDSEQKVQEIAKQQDVSLKNADASQVPSELQGAAESLLISGDIITRGAIKIVNNGVVTTLTGSNATTNQTVALPQASGTFCLDSNNCNYASAAQLAGLQTSLNQLVIPAAGVNSVNDQKGSVTVQGSLNQISVSTNGGVVTLSTPQNLDSSANVQFGNLTLSAGGQIIANGRTFQLPNSGAASQIICTTTVGCAGGGGGSGDISQGGNSFATPVTIGTNDVQNLQLETSGTTRLTIDTSGNATFSGGVSAVNFSGDGSGLTSLNATNISSGTLADGRLSVNVSLLGQTIDSGEIVNGTITGTDIGNNTVTNGNLVNSSLTVTAGNGLSGGGSVALGASTNLAVVYGSAANTAVQGNTAITITAGTGLSGGGSITLGAGGSSTLNVTYGSSANTAVQGNTQLTCGSGTGNLSGGGNVITLGSGGTCNNMTITNSPVFSGTLAVQGATTTIGADSQQGSVVLYDGGTGAASHTGTVQVIGSLAQNTTYILPDPGGASANICLSTGNCAGAGGGVTTPGGVSGNIAKFTGSGSIDDSTLSESGSTVTATGNLVIQGANSLTVGTSSSLDGSVIFRTAAGANTVSLQAPASNPASNLIFKLPSAYGANGDCVKSDGAGNLSLTACTGGAGGGVTSIDGLTGVVTINNATGSGSAITIDDATTAAKGIASFSSTNFDVSSGAVSIKTGGVGTNEIADGTVTGTDIGSNTIASGNITDSTIVNGDLAGGTYSSITGVGTLTAGSWNASTIAAQYGGTGISSYTTGDLLYASGATTLSKLAAVAAGQCLVSNGVGVAPIWSACPGGGSIGGSGTSGQVAYFNGGTSLTSSANLLFNGTDLTVGGVLQGTQLVSTVSTGTAPLTVTSTTVVTNLNSDLLDGQHGAFYQDASNLNAGVIGSARVSGSYTGITGVGTITTGTWNGTAIADTYLQDNITISSGGSVDWTALTNYPTACAAGSAVSTLADVPTCTAFATGTTASYIQNQFAVNQTADFRISGNGALGGSLGIGTVPSYKLHVAATSTATSGTGISNVGTSLGLTVTPASAPAATTQYYGLQSNVTTASTNVNANTSLLASSSNAHNFSTGTLGGAVGLEAAVFNWSTGSITSAIGLTAGVANLGAGTINTANGVIITGTNAGAGSINTAIGLTIQAQDLAGVGTGYGVWQDGANDLNYFAGNVGIGTTVPGYKLHVDATSIASSGIDNAGSRFVLNVTPASAPAALTVYLASKTSTTSSSANVNANTLLRGSDNEVVYSGTGTVGTAIALNGTVFNTAAGSITSATGVAGSVANLGSGNIGLGVGLQANTPSAGTGSITTAVGLLLFDQKVAGVTSGYGVWQNGTNDLNYFGGNVGIGTTIPNTALDLQGGFTIRSSSAPANAPSDQGRFYYDATTDTIKLSLNSGGYNDICTTATCAIGTAASYIQNQFASAQTTADFWISGSGRIDGGNLQVGNGTPTVTLNGEDAYIEGTLEVDSSARFDGNVSVISNFTVTQAGNVAFQRNTTNYAATGTQDDINFGTGALFRITSASALTITSIAGGADGRIITLMNASSFAVTINNDAGGTAANRIITGTGSNITIPAGSSVKLIYDSSASRWRIVGGVSTGTGTTASRANSAPNEGTMYYDTDTKQILTYSNGKWQADRGDATYVAASDSSQTDKDRADYLANGNTGAAADGDQVEINNALTAANGKKVVLLAGTYTIDASISVPNNTTLAGVGAGSLITVPNSFNASIDAITNTTTGGNGTNITIQDLRLDGNKSNQSSGSMRGIYLNGLGSGTGSSAIPGAKVTNLRVHNWRSDGFLINLSSSNNTFTGNTAQGNSNCGFQVLNTSTNNTFTGNTAQGNTVSGFCISTDSNTVTGNTAQGNTQSGFLISGSKTTVTGNTAQGNGTDGFTFSTSLKNSVTGNTAQGNGDDGFEFFNVSSNNTITGNTTHGNTNAGFNFNSSSSNNTLSGNTIMDSGGSANNNGIYLSGSDSNTITSNNITDTDGHSTTNYAINISNSTSDTNYLADNSLGGGSINDVGTGTIYGGQVNSSTNYVVQPAGTIELMKNTNVTGILSASTSVLAPTVDTASAVALNIGNTNASSISIGKTSSNIGITLSGTTIIKTTSGNDSATAFQVQNGAGNTIFGVDTSGSQALLGKASTITGKMVVYNSTNANTITIQSGVTSAGYTLTLPTALGTSGQCIKDTTGTGVLGWGACAAGAGGSTRKITLVPEYPGGVISADGSNNTGNLTSDFDGTNVHNYYNWTSTQGSLNDYDVIVRTALPSEYASGFGTFKIWAYGGSTSTSNNNIQVTVKDAAGTACASSVSVLPGTANTWTEQSVTIAGCTFAANDLIVISVKLSSLSSNAVRIGEISYQYTN